jgi:hypothetical protein
LAGDHLAQRQHAALVEAGNVIGAAVGVVGDARLRSGVDGAPPAG